MIGRLLCAAVAIWIAAATAGVRAVDDAPTARLVAAPALEIPAPVDSGMPMAWDLVDGSSTLFVMASWGGLPAVLQGPQLERLQRGPAVTIGPGPGNGVWMESVLPDEGGTWYGFYHHEAPADVCGRPDRTLVDIGAARSRDHGQSWENLGIVLEEPRGSQACGSLNRFLLGGVGDPTVILDAVHQYVYVYFSQYGKDPAAQGVAIARMPWADRDEPVGQFAVFQDGIWLPARQIDAGSGPAWDYPFGTPLVPVGNPWHGSDFIVDAFWGASIHWNTYLERYVMLLNRAKNENFDNEGIYVSYSTDLADRSAWTAPVKLMNGGGWYPQVAGLEAGGTDRQAGRRARFFVTGRSSQYIEFSR